VDSKLGNESELPACRAVIGVDVSVLGFTPEMIFGPYLDSNLPLWHRGIIAVVSGQLSVVSCPLSVAVLATDHWH
jgi:hypothetical protein